MKGLLQQLCMHGVPGSISTQPAVEVEFSEVQLPLSRFLRTSRLRSSRKFELQGYADGAEVQNEKAPLAYSVFARAAARLTQRGSYQTKAPEDWARAPRGLPFALLFSY